MMKHGLLVLSVFCSLAAFGADKVIGGTETSNNEYPWQVSLQTRFNSHFCGGVIIDNRTIVTVAHCVASSEVRTTKVKGGSRDGTTRRLKSLGRIAEIIIHPDFKSKKVVAHDIALIKMRREIQFSERVKAIEIPSLLEIDLQKEFSSMTGKLVISGWGKTNLGGFPLPSAQLMVAELRPLGSSSVDLFDQELRDYLSANYDLQDSNVDYLQSDNSRTLILEGKKSGASPCGGDSGGPITYFSKSGPLLFGISSYVAGGDRPCVAIAGATDVQAYLDWINAERAR